MTTADIIASAAATTGAIYTVYLAINVSLKKTIRIETESIRETLIQHTEKLESIEAQTKKTNGRVNRHDDQIAEIDKTVAVMQSKGTRRKTA